MVVRLEPVRILSIVLSLLLTSMAVPDAGAARSLRRKMPTLEKVVTVRPHIQAHVYRLDNGLQVVLTPNAAAPLVSIHHWVKAGSLHETPGITGIAHLFEHMMFRSFVAQEPSFWDHAGRLGGKTSAITHFESTLYYSTVPREHLREMLGLEARRFQRLRVTEELLAVEREAVRSEYSTKVDTNPIADLWDTIYRVAFPGHPYGWGLVGFREDLEKIRADDCNRFFAKYYSPDKTGLFVSGNFSRELVLQWIVEDYSAWQPSGPGASVDAFAEPRRLTIAEAKLGARSRNLLIGYRVPGFDRDNHEILALVNHVLFGSEYSLARRRLHDRDKIASHVASMNFENDNGMLKAFVVLTETGSLDRTIEALGRLMEDFERLEPREWSAYLREYQVLRAETILRNDALNEALSLSWGKYGDAAFLADAVRAPSTLSHEAAVAFMKPFLVPHNLVVVTGKGGKSP